MNHLLKLRTKKCFFRNVSFDQGFNCKAWLFIENGKKNESFKMYLLVHRPVCFSSFLASYSSIVSIFSRVEEEEDVFAAAKVWGYLF